MRAGDGVDLAWVFAKSDDPVKPGGRQGRFAFRQAGAIG
jgi:hypothetical protein